MPAPPGPALTFVVMAAGIGSRFEQGKPGAVKQLEPVGPGGETILDYNVFDARRAGFERVVFVVRPELHQTFDRQLGAPIARHVDVEYAHQTLAACLDGRAVPATRTRPWGTAQAALVARPLIRGSCAVVNADDFYGRSSIALLGGALRAEPDCHHLVAYPLGDTLSSAGGVSRGLVRADAAGFMSFLEPITEVEWSSDSLSDSSGGPVAGFPERRVHYLDSSGAARVAGPDALASMNLWGFAPVIFDQLQAAFDRFLTQLGAAADHAELGLPGVVEEGARSSRCRVRVHRAQDRWLGLTHYQDVAPARERLALLHRAGEYPDRLWP